MKNLKLKTLLLALGLSFGFTGVTMAGPGGGAQCEEWLNGCIADDVNACRLYVRYC